MSMIESPAPVEDLHDTIEDETTLTAEALIEEVSIDGMCGVY
jgi:mycofactocin precursor